MTDYLNKIPEKTSDIFEKLSSGGFICSNTLDRVIKELFDITDYNYDILREYFLKIGFELESREDYFYFSKNNKTSDEKKLERFYNYIDLMDFFKTFDTSFVSGFTFNLSDISKQCDTDPNLKNKLNFLKSDKKSSTDKIRDILKELKNDGYIEQISPQDERYKVLASFSYLENIVNLINIEEDENEIS